MIWRSSEPLSTSSGSSKTGKPPSGRRLPSPHFELCAGPQPTARASDVSAIAHNYARLFSTVLADDEPLREQSHRLRYAAYCVENSFESPEDHPDALEADAFDRHSLHGLLVHRPTGLAIGSVRTIMPNADAWWESLPIQAICHHPMVRDRATVMQSLEASRFCISRTMRKQICSINAYKANHLSGEHRDRSSASSEIYDIVSMTLRLLPYLSLGLIKFVLQMAVERELPWIFATIDPRLLQLLGQLGICSQRIGDDVDYHGLRVPVLFKPLAIFENVYGPKREVWTIISEQGRLHELALRLGP